jgi:hypothetical protein
MKGFKEYVSERQDLQEGLIRTTALLAWSNQSKTFGDKAGRAFTEAKGILGTSAPADTLSDQVQRIQKALVLMCDGMLALRQQAGSAVAMNLTGHLLTSQTGAELLKKKV